MSQGHPGGGLGPFGEVGVHRFVEVEVAVGHELHGRRRGEQFGDRGKGHGNRAHWFLGRIGIIDSGPRHGDFVGFVQCALQNRNTVSARQFAKPFAQQPRIHYTLPHVAFTRNPEQRSTKNALVGLFRKGKTLVRERRLTPGSSAR